MKVITFKVANDEQAQYFVEDAAKTDGVIAFTDDEGMGFEMQAEEMTIADV
jgi:hypothetical protein